MPHLAALEETKKRVARKSACFPFAELNTGGSPLATESADMDDLACFWSFVARYDEELIDPQTIGRSELDEAEASPRGASRAQSSCRLINGSPMRALCARGTLLRLCANYTFPARAD